MAYPSPLGKMQPPSQSMPIRGQIGGGGQGQGGGYGGYGGGSNNPMQPIYAPAPPYGQAAFSNLNLSPQQTIQQILKGFMPAQRQATSALNNTLAAGGIVGGGAQGAQNLLQGQLSASLAPTLANAIQTSQGMQLGQAQGNQQAQNSMTGQNLQDWMQTNMFNTQNANQSRDTFAQMLQNAWLTQAGGLQGILGQGLSAGGNLAGIGAQQFPIYQNSGLLGMLGL